MPRKKIDFSKKLKISEFSNTTSADQSGLTIDCKPLVSRLNILEHRQNPNTISFRFRKIDMERLVASLDRTNQENESHPFNRTDLIRGLIYLSTKIPPKKILDCIRKSV